MVTLATFFVGSIWGFALGILFTHWYLGLSMKPDVKPEPLAFEKFKFWKPDVEPPKDYPVKSIPRTRGPWRRQKQALEAQHNSKQKNLDALTGGL